MFLWYRHVIPKVILILILKVNFDTISAGIITWKLISMHFLRTLAECRICNAKNVSYTRELQRVSQYFLPDNISIQAEFFKYWKSPFLISTGV